MADESGENMPVRHEINGYWSLSPKNRKRIDAMLKKLIADRKSGKKGEEDVEGSIQQGD